MVSKGNGGMGIKLEGKNGVEMKLELHTAGGRVQRKLHCKVIEKANLAACPILWSPFSHVPV